jgi:hypothetical protein
MDVVNQMAAVDLDGETPRAPIAMRRVLVLKKE